MKAVLLVVLVLVLMAGTGVAGYFYGENVGFTQAQTIRNEFFQSRTQTGAQGDNTQGQFQSGQQGQRGGGTGGAAARNTTNGTVKGVQGNSIQVTLRDGSTVTVNVDSQTVIQQTVTGTIGDIKNGENITVLSDQSGSTITARTIQVRTGGQ